MFSPLQDQQVRTQVLPLVDLKRNTTENLFLNEGYK